MTDTLPTKEEWEKVRDNLENDRYQDLHAPMSIYDGLKLLSIIDAYGEAVREMVPLFASTKVNEERTVTVSTEQFNNLRSLAERYGRKP